MRARKHKLGNRSKSRVEKIRKASKRMWRNRSVSERRVIGSKISKKLSASMTQLWKNPEYRERACAGRSQRTKNLWKDPQYRNRVMCARDNSPREKKRIKEFTKCTIERFSAPGYADVISKRMLAEYACGKRVPAFRNSQFSQGWTTTKKGGRFFYHSSWELLFAQILDSAKIVKEFKYEPFGIPYTYCRERHTYFPDFWVKLKDGREFVLELRGWNRGGRGYKEKNKFKAAQKYCQDRNMDFVCLVGRDCQEVIQKLKPIIEVLQ